MPGPGKWERFRSSHTPLDITKPDSRDANLQADWFRATTEADNEDDRPGMNIIVNGKPLVEWAPSFNGFATKEDVMRFFKDEILKDLPKGQNTNRENDVEEMVAYLATVFHQGGLLYPVSSALADSMRDNNPNNKKTRYALLKSTALTKRSNIVSTATGFQVQEFAQARSLLAMSDQLVTESEKQSNNKDQYPAHPGTPVLLPAPGKDYVVKCQGTIDVNFDNFKKNNNQPNITVVNSSIDYGHPTIQKKMDKRSFGQRIVDFFKYHLGLTKVKDISPPPKTEAAKDTAPEETSSHHRPLSPTM